MSSWEKMSHAARRTEYVVYINHGLANKRTADENSSMQRNFQKKVNILKTFKGWFLFIDSKFEHFLAFYAKKERDASDKGVLWAPLLLTPLTMT